MIIMIQQLYVVTHHAQLTMQDHAGGFLYLAVVFHKKTPEM